MKKKRVYDLTEIDELKKEDFPVADILRKNSERIGCASVALVNAIELLNYRVESEKRSELSLMFEHELQSKNGVVDIQIFLQFIDGFSKERNIECMSCYETKPNLTALLFLLVNGFCFLVYNASTESDVGHIDVIWHDKETKKIYFNAWPINQEEFEQLVYHDKSFLIGLRSLKEGRFLFFQKDIENLTVSLTGDQEVFLQKSEKLLLARSLDEIQWLQDFCKLPRDELLKNKVELLVNIGRIPKNYLVI